MMFNRIEDIIRIDFTEGGKEDSFMAINRYHRAITDAYKWSGETGCLLLTDSYIYNMFYVAVGTEELIDEEYDNWNNWQSTVLPNIELDKMFATQIIAKGKNHLIFKKWAREKVGDYRFKIFNCPC